MSPDPRVRASNEILEPNPLVDTRLGEYQVLQQIGGGGTSVVYLAEHLHDGRRVAIKVLSADPLDGTIHRRYAVPWERLAKLNHPNIVPIHDVIESETSIHVAMKCVEGRSLAEMIEQDGALDPTTALQLLDQVATALAFAHDRGIVHGNLKPHNVLVEPSDGHAGRVYVTDFALTSNTPGQLRLLSRPTGRRNYLSPEQCEGDPIDARSDVYALGCALFEALTGSPPFPEDRLIPDVDHEVPSVHERQPDLPAAIDAVLQRALAKSKEDRFEKPSDVVAAAHEVLVGPRLKLPQPLTPTNSNEFVPAPPSSLPQTPPGPEEPVINLVPYEDTVVRRPLSRGESHASPPMLPAEPEVVQATHVDGRVPAGTLIRPAHTVVTHRRAVLAAACLLLGLALVGGIAVAIFQDDLPLPVVTTDQEPVETTPPAESEPPGGTTEPIEPSLAAVRAPRNVEVTFIGTDAVRIEWERPANGTPPVRFVVVRDGERLGRVTRSFYEDEDVGPGERHVYRIISVGEDRSTARSRRLIVLLADLPDPVQSPPSFIPATPAPAPASFVPPTQQCAGLAVGTDCLA
jgi:serine/threonine protein kinase